MSVDTHPQHMTQDAAARLIADFFGIHPRTVLRWHQAGLNLFDPEEVASFVRRIQRPSPGVVRRLADGNLEEELRSALNAEEIEPFPFEAKVLALIKDARTGLLIARRLWAEDPELLQHFGGKTAAFDALRAGSVQHLGNLLAVAHQLLLDEVQEISHHVRNTPHHTTAA